MFTTLAEVGISDLATFLSVFATRGAEMRRKHGSRYAGVWAADDSRAFVLIDWDSREHFERFRADPAVPPTMKIRRHHRAAALHAADAGGRASGLT